MTEGQRLAIEQMHDVERESEGDSFTVHSTNPTSGPSGNVLVEFTVLCRDLRSVPTGISFRDRERFSALIPPSYPFVPPSLWVSHDRFAGFPHVQWKHHLCLYASPDTEWNPSDGMFGFLGRVERWLEHAAMDQLDPTGAPLHPPVAYPSSGTELIVPLADTPVVVDSPWIGLMAMGPKGDERLDVIGWADLLAPPIAPRIGVACLLHTPLPFEYPESLSALLLHLETAGISTDRFLRCLEWAAFHNPDGTPLHVAIGTPTRGVRGAVTRAQHLAFWRVDPSIADCLRLTPGRFSTNQEIQASSERLLTSLRGWAKTATVHWCRVGEARPEVTARRDIGTSLSNFFGKTVSIWGLGALGGHVAEMLARAGVRKLLLHDNGLVTPGLIARQPYEDADIGQTKVGAMSAHLKRIAPAIEVATYTSNVLTGPLASEDWTSGADFVIDATASLAVLTKSETRRASRPHDSLAPLVAMVVDSSATHGMVSYIGPRHLGGSFDVARRAKLAAITRATLATYLEAFWPTARRPVFQPEPGCSSSTFIGSASDVQALAAMMLNIAGSIGPDASASNAVVDFISQPARDGLQSRGSGHLEFTSDVVCQDPGSGYEIRIAGPAWSDMLGWISKARRTLGGKIETGGILFGEHDSTLRIIWVSEIIGPPSDSDSSPDGFVTGILGVKEANAEKQQRTKGSVAFVGMWHTHPNSAPIPSATDLSGMAQIVGATGSANPKALLLILGGSDWEALVFGAYLFKRSDFASQGPRVQLRGCQVRRAPRPRKPTRNVGLSLSGGGARAMAFHLGCLRALHDRGILDRLAVVSTVSGGSVIGAMYAFSADSFEAFDSRVVTVLREGLAVRIAKEALAPEGLVRSAIGLASNGVVAAGLAMGRFGAWGLSRLGVPLDHRSLSRAPLRRRYSRTEAFRLALNDALFDGQNLSTPIRSAFDMVINATELCTGTAFRFSNRGSGGHRFGELVVQDVPIALAVAASAAYPALLPALDRTMNFLRRDGTTAAKRVILTDGGVYDNLGCLCMEPGRSSDVSYHSYTPEYIIACDAGLGKVEGDTIPYLWPSRMSLSLETMFRRVQNSSRDRLHRHVASGALKGFVHSYLGLHDQRLPWAPPQLVPRRAVEGYPTDFSAMSETNIALLADRGEQVTRLLLSHYCPEL